MINVASAALTSVNYVTGGEVTSHWPQAKTSACVSVAAVASRLCQRPRTPAKGVKLWTARGRLDHPANPAREPLLLPLTTNPSPSLPSPHFSLSLSLFYAPHCLPLPLLPHPHSSDVPFPLPSLYFAPLPLLLPPPPLPLHTEINKTQDSATIHGREAGSCTPTLKTAMCGKYCLTVLTS